MKKLFAIALIATVLVSCNKEAKTEESTTTETIATPTDTMTVPAVDSSVITTTTTVDVDTTKK